MGAGRRGVVDLRAYAGSVRVLGEWPPEAPPSAEDVAALADAARKVLQAQAAA